MLLNYLNDSIFRINMALDSGQSTTFDAMRSRETGNGRTSHYLPLVKPVTAVMSGPGASWRA